MDGSDAAAERGLQRSRTGRRAGIPARGVDPSGGIMKTARWALVALCGLGVAACDDTAQGIKKDAQELSLIHI